MTGEGRRTIMGKDAPSYRGPEQIALYYNSANDVIKRKVRDIEKVQPCPYPEESQRHFLTVWISACREGEAILLEPDKWKISANSIGYRKVPVLKKREKVRDKNGKPIYKKVEAQVRQQDGSLQTEIIYRPESRQKIEYREHIMPRDTPLCEKFIQIVTKLQEQGYKYILYRKTAFYRDSIPDKHCSTRTVVNRITELHPDLFPHGIRALHIRYLRDRYGRAFGPEKIKDHLKWSSTEMVYHYLGGQEIADAMGITVPW